MKNTILVIIILFILSVAFYQATAGTLSSTDELTKTYTIYYRLKNSEDMKCTQWEYPKKWTINKLLNDIAEHGVKTENEHAFVLVTPEAIEGVVIFKKKDKKVPKDLTT